MKTENALKGYKGSLISAFYIFSLSILVWLNTNYNFIPLIIGINGLNFYLNPKQSSRLIDIFSNVLIYIYVFLPKF